MDSGFGTVTRAYEDPKFLRKNFRPPKIGGDLNEKMCYERNGYKTARRPMQPQMFQVFKQPCMPVTTEG
jgi:hypothetical protein